MPTSLSSVSLYYDPDYSFLNLGVFTAIREIEYMKFIKKYIDSNFKYYVLGLYIDTCQKMRYKGEYRPLQILDQFTYNFVYLDQVRDIIKDNKLHKLTDKEDNPEFKKITGDEIDHYYKNLNIEYGNNQFPLSVFIEGFIGRKHQEFLIKGIKEYLQLAGKDIVYRTVFTIK